MDKKYIIKKNQEIDCIIHERNSVGNKYFVIYKKNMNEASFRFAISIGKKYGNAVSRNLMKRRIREIIRKNINDIKKYDFILVVKKDSSSLSFEEIEQNIMKLFRKVQ